MRKEFKRKRRKKKGWRQEMRNSYMIGISVEKDEEETRNGRERGDEKEVGILKLLRVDEIEVIGLCEASQVENRVSSSVK